MRSLSLRFDVRAIALDFLTQFGLARARWAEPLRASGSVTLQRLDPVRLRHPAPVLHHHRRAVAVAPAVAALAKPEIERERADILDRAAFASDQRIGQVLARFEQVQIAPAGKGRAAACLVWRAAMTP